MAEYRALVVTADRPDADAIGHLLHEQGFLVDWAASESMALALYQQLSPDLVVLRGDVPGASVTDLCHTLRAQSVLPILIVTGAGVPVELGDQQCADAELAWPFTPDQLHETIDTVRRSRRRTVDLTGGEVEATSMGQLSASDE